MMYAQNTDFAGRINFIDDPVTPFNQFPDKFIFEFRNNSSRLRIHDKYINLVNKLISKSHCIRWRVLSNLVINGL